MICLDKISELVILVQLFEYQIIKFKNVVKMFGCFSNSLYLCRCNEKEFDNGRADAFREQSETVHRAESAD